MLCISWYLRDKYGRLDKDHQVIVKEHASQLQELISTKSGGLLDELIQREVITAAHKHDIMASISGSIYRYFMLILIYIHDLSRQISICSIFDNSYILMRQQQPRICWICY